jgi:hypothetical protein
VSADLRVIGFAPDEASGLPIALASWDEASEIIEALEAKLAAALNAQAEPVGEWVMVPREPTLAMLGAGRAKARDGYTLEAAWEAMLAAAPDRGGA